MIQVTAMTPRSTRHLKTNRVDRLAVPATNRRGSVLLVMLGLLLLLMVLGFTALTFTAQEHESANYYAEGSQKTGVEVSSDVLFDYALEQLLIGPRQENMQSVLWPGRHSLIPNMLGMFGTHPDESGRTFPLDLHPFNGVGINLVSDNQGLPVVLDQSGQAISNKTAANLLLSSNFSPAALNDQDVTREALIASLPTPDVDYTYPDINNVFLAHTQQVPVNPQDPTRVVPVLIPSFHRPQYLRLTTQGGNNRVDVDSAGNRWDQSSETATKVMRPHKNHMVVIYDGTQNKPILKFKSFPNGISRFAPGPGGIPLLDQQTSLIDPNNNGLAREQGIWSLGSTANLQVYDQRLRNYEYDVDNRGTGVRDGVWLDLGHPPFFLKDGRGVVPLFSFTVLPADGLINLNTAGNINALVTQLMTTSKTDLQQAPVSRSNFGRSASEINPFWALAADPTQNIYLSPSVNAGNVAPLLQHMAFQKYNPANQGVINRVEMANLEMLFLQWGRPDFDVSNTSLIAGGTVPVGKIVEGRYGETLNTESGWLNTGAAQPDRWTRFPRPGQPVPNGANLTLATQMIGGNITGAPGDDNYNQFTGWAIDGANQSLFADQHLGVATREITPPSYVSVSGLRYPMGTGPARGWPSGHPQDLVGAGNYLELNNKFTGGFLTGLTTSLAVDPNNPTGPVRWPQYERFAGGSRLGTTSTATLVNSVNLFGLIDEPAEMIVDRRYRFPGIDSPFPTDELFALHASAGDYAAASTGSRLRELMPFNFEINQQAESIRSRFTTDSWDRVNHSFHYDPQRPWEWTDAQKPNGDPIAGYISFPAVINPKNKTTTDYIPDPFRREVKSLIGMVVPAANTVPTQPQLSDFSRLQFLPEFAGRNLQHRLDINRLAWLMDPNTSNPMQRWTPALAGNSGFLNNIPRFRRLTPHVADPGSGLLPTNSSRPPNLAPVDQEYWAGQDRQFLAQDIYTLLYMYGADFNNGDPLSQDIYQPWQKLEMAQFAVNLVDAMDPDDVITDFRFDPNLVNGWDTSIDNDLVNGVSAVVYGVDAQTLTLSEVLCGHQTKTPNDEDHSATPYDDGDADRWFTHVELRNVSPHPIDISKGTWRISVIQQQFTDRRLAGPRRPVPHLRTSLVFKRNPRSSNPNVIPPGGLFTIGTMGRDDGSVDTFNDTNGNSVVRSADLRMDADDLLDETFRRLSPLVAEANPPNKTTDSPPGCSLDLNHNLDYGKNYWQLIDYSGGTTDVTSNPQFRGGFLRGNIASGPANLDPTAPIKFILERRAHVGRSTPNAINAQYDNQNPWITVDEFTVQPQELKIDGSDSQLPQTELRNRLLQLASSERDVPLVRTTANSVGVSNLPVPQLPNTIAQNNSRPQPNSVVWQPHFDRDFTSVMDLLGIPLYGPHLTTARLAAGNRLLMETSIDGTPSTVFPPNPVACVAAAKFLQPTHPSPPSPQSKEYNNAWYRVLELLEVRPLDQDAIVTQRPELWNEVLTRTPGRLQLNALPHADNLFALLDEPRMFNLKPANDQTLFAEDIREPLRNWWFELLRSRDGIDPLLQRFASGDPVILPGSPAARPFRGLSHSMYAGPGNGANAVPLPEVTEHGVLRRLGMDTTPNYNEPINTQTPTSLSQAAQSYRRLFEARSQADLSVGEIDLQSRHRLLGKIANNSTTRGNVFLVWTSIGFFDAVFPDPQNPAIVQIGAELEDQSRRRGFFVVDRSLLEDAYVPPTYTSTGTQMPGTFDFRKFVQYRRTLQ